MKNKRSHRNRKKFVHVLSPYEEQILLWNADGKLDRNVASKATQPMHKHHHSRAALPSGQREVNAEVMTPAAYRRWTHFKRTRYEDMA